MKHIKNTTKSKRSAFSLAPKGKKEEWDFFISENGIEDKKEASRKTKKEKQTGNKISDLFFLSGYPREGD